MIFSPVTKKESERIVEAIKKAEKNTSGEIRVHIQRCLFGDIMNAAQKKFVTLGLHKTAQKNGVLFYVVFQHKKIAILGDEGINAAVPKDFWQSTIDLMLEYFKRGEMIAGIEAGVDYAGKALGQYFPHEENDRNEVSNELSIG